MELVVVLTFAKLCLLLIFRVEYMSEKPLQKCTLYNAFCVLNWACWRTKEIHNFKTPAPHQQKKRADSWDSMKLSKFDAVGVNVKVYLEDDGEWHDGMVEEYHPRRGYHFQLFDGQDLWLENLDDNVQFEKEYDLEGDTNEAGQTMGTEMSFHDDELAFLQDAEEVLQSEEEHVDHEELDGGDLTVPDYKTHQDYNQRAIRADLPTLPTRGVLLSGSVLGAAGLATDGEDVLDGNVFFKVLFVEGGSQPSMFRCKTPIYTSQPVPHSLSNPRWNGARFQFDMIMPVDAVQDAKSPYGFKIQGEIIVAVYMSRSSGGNSLLGQASFQLKDLVATGTVEFFAAGYEGRSVTGAHTILSRAGDISGEIDVQLNIAWKSLNAGLGPSQLTSSQSQLAAGLLPPRPASATAITGGASRAGSAPRGGGLSRTKGTATAGVASQRDGSAARSRPASSAANKGIIAPPRKIVSNIQRKQREDAARIAKENKKLQHTLEQHANRGGAAAGGRAGGGASGGASAVGSAYATGGIAAQSTRPSSATATATVGGNNNKRLSMAADAKETADSRDYKASGRAAASAKAASDQQTTEALVRIYNDLKRSTALDEQENARLKLKVGKLKVSIKQAEMTVDRIRSESGSAGSAGSAGSVGDAQSKGSASGAMRTSMRGSRDMGNTSSINNNNAHSSGSGTNLRSQEGRTLMQQAQPKDGNSLLSATNTPRTQAKGESANNNGHSHTHSSHVAHCGAHEYIPFFAPMTDAQLEALGVRDVEYKSLAEEYTVLQAVRRGMLDRLATAKASCASSSEKQMGARERLEMIRRRVDYYRDIAGKLAIGVALQLPDGGVLGDAKRVTIAVDEDECGSGGNGPHNDFTLFDRLREGKQEYVTECALFEAGMHTIAQDNALEELRAVRDLLASKCTATDATVRRLKEENDTAHQQLREAMSQQRELDVDAYVRQLRVARGKHGRKGSLSAAAEERLKIASDALAAVDRQLRGVKERQGERRSSRVVAEPSVPLETAVE